MIEQWIRLKEKVVDVDDQVMGGNGTVPLLLFFRDNRKNRLLIGQSEQQWVDVMVSLNWPACWCESESGHQRLHSTFGHLDSCRL